ncbi:MAG: prolipoprotein diacylglyceryl transferase [Candidatus Zixiibacteriota bacterium]
MYPELFHIGPVPVRAFGLMLALSFLAGVYYIQRVALRDRKPFDTYLMFAYIMIFGGILGARLSYAALHWSDFANNLLDIFNPFQSGQFGIAGLNLYGGILFGMAGSIIYARLKYVPVLDVFDYFAPTIGLGIGISRIGCFLNGCCFGTPTHLPWGVEFPPDSIPYMIFGSQHLHPSQIYSSLYGLGLFVALHHLVKHRRFTGQVTAIFLMVEAVFRYAIEYVRYYESEMHFSLWGMHPTWNQVVSWSLFLGGLAVYVVSVRKHNSAGNS